MITVAIYLTVCALLVLFLITSVGYSQTEEMTSADRSPKHHLIWTAKNKLTLSLIVMFLAATMVL